MLMVHFNIFFFYQYLHCFLLLLLMALWENRPEALLGCFIPRALHKQENLLGLFPGKPSVRCCCGERTEGWESRLHLLSAWLF